MGKKSKKEKKTDNDLDEKFQWHEGLDPDHIFDEEKELIAQLRKEVPQLENETDKFVACFLFGRRHDIKDTLELLRNFYTKKAEVAEIIDHHQIPSFTYTKILQDNPVTRGIPVLQPVGFRDNKGRMIRMMFMEQIADEPINDQRMIAFFFWQLYYVVATEPLNAWRNGFLMISDMANVKFSIINKYRSQGGGIAKLIQGTFPIRIRSILAVNGGAVLKALYAVMNLVLPKKMIKRFQVMDASRLPELIPPEYLISNRFGGNGPTFTFEDFQKQILEKEAEIFASGAWKKPEEK